MGGLEIHRKSRGSCKVDKDNFAFPIPPRSAFLYVQTGSMNTALVGYDFIHEASGAAIANAIKPKSTSSAVYLPVHAAAARRRVAMSPHKAALVFEGYFCFV